MNSAHLLRSTGLCVLLSACGLSGPSATSEAAQPPNIVFFLADDQRNDQLGCAGHAILQTPHIDRLAAGGTRFTNAFVTTSICAASRATIFTGLYERTHKFTFRTPPLAERFTRQSYPAVLRRAGYRTGFIGKFGVGVAPGAREEMFDVFKPLNRSPYFKPQPDGGKRHITQIAGDLAVEFLRDHAEAHGERPFCLSVSFNAPHAEDGDKQNHYPWPKSADGLYEDVTVPPPHLSEPEVFESQPEFLQRSLNRQRWFWRWDTPEKYQKNMKGYWRMISGVDHTVGRVLEELQRRGLAENTVVIYSADNGYYLGSRGFAGKWSHYEESLRAPLIVYDPRMKKDAATQESTALNVDIPATILDLAGVEVPESYQGRSLTGLLGGEKPESWREDFFCEHLMHYPGGIPKWEGVRGERWKYARYFEPSPPYEFLHDLKSDSRELRNLAGDPQHREALAAMRARCDELRDQYGGEYTEEKFPNTAGSARRRARSRAQSTSSSDGKPSPPNVVMMISDDQAWTDYSFMGHPEIQTPRLDRLARQSLTFTRGYVPTGLCRPSLATLITGLYAHQHGITGNDPAIPPGVARNSEAYQKLRERLIAKIDDVPTLPGLLGEAGYLSHQSGKWWEGNHSRGGFTHGMTHGDPKRGGRHGDAGLKIGREGMQPVLDFLDATGEKPFFLWYAPFLPHTPHNPPERLLEKYRADDRPIELARYYAMCEWFDESCGQLLDALEKRGLAENTLVVYVTDNGWIQRTPRTDAPTGWNQRFAPRSKQSPHEGGIRTPTMLRWPGKIRPRLDERTLVSSIDLAPTILSACGAEAPDDLPGEDLMALADGGTLAREAIFGEGFAHDVADLDDPRASLLYRWVIQNQWKLILKHDGQVGRYRAVHASVAKGSELYDLLADPHERNNLAEEHPGVVKELRSRLNAWWPATDR